MDLATLIGVVGAISCIIAAIMMGGEMGMFVNAPSIMIVIGGSIAVVMMKFSLTNMLGAFGVALKAFIHKTQQPREIIEQSVELPCLFPP